MIMRAVALIIPFLFFGTLIEAKILVIDDDLEKQWVNFKLNHDKKYATPQEEQHRKDIFTENYKMIIEHNKLFAKGEESYSMKINQFSDISEDEMEGYMGLDNSELEQVAKLQEIHFDLNSPAIPDKIDWRQLGAVTGVKSQDDCKSCWAFASTGAVEGQYYLKTGKLVSLSEQNLIDCSNITENHGCGGGTPFKAYEYIIINDGIDSEDSYPYKAKDEKCVYNTSANITTIQFFGKTTEGSEETLKVAVATIGPIATLIHVDEHFKSYDSGVFYSKLCNIDRHKKIMNHSGLIVGYGTTQKGREYWIFKNSWGKSWGEDGYIRMARNRDNNCEIATYPNFPIMY